MAFDLTAALRLNDVNFTSGMRSARRSMGGLRSGASEVVKQLGLITGAAGAVGVAFLSVKKAMDFETQMSTIKALTGATGAEMKQMTDLAMEMGAKTKYSALEAGQGIEELLKAGLTPAAVKAGGLEAALNLATAGGLDLAEASEIMSTALNAFKDDAMTAAQAANILAGTANASATDVHDLRYSLSMVSAVASGIGLSFKDTNAALGVFANNGLKGSDAGTSLKTLLLNLSPITKAQTKEFKALGITTKDGSNQFFDAKGNIKSMAEIAGVLQKQLKGLTNEQRQAALKTMFGTDAIRAANILYKEGTKGVNDFKKEMSKVTALDVAKEKMNNASGAIEVLKGALETFQIQVMTPLLPVIKDAANQFGNWMSSIKPEQVQAMGDKIRDAGQAVLDFANFIRNNWVPIRETVIALTAGILALRAGMLALMIIKTINTLMIAYRAGTLAATLAQWGLNTAMLANPIGLVIIAIAALVAAGVFLYRNWDAVKEKTQQLWAKLGAFKGVATLVLGPLGFIIRAAVTMAEQWDSTKGVWENVWNGIKIAAANAVNDVIGSINKMIGIINKIPGVNIPIVPKVNWGKYKGVNENASTTIARTGKTSSGHAISSHASGLNRVPYDGYIARLHKNERVLTSNEAKGYNGKGGGNTYQFHVQMHGTGSTEKDAEKLFELFVRKVEAAGGAGA
jgi:TP901 family phage tail tape measure protein